MQKKEEQGGRRLRAFRFFFLFFGFAILFRLAALQIIDGKKYYAIAEGQHARYEELVPKRGSIFARDAFSDTWYPLATSQPRALVYGNPSEIQDPEEVAVTIARIVDMDGLAEYEALHELRTLRAVGRFTDAQEKENAIIEQVRAAYFAEQEISVHDSSENQDDALQEDMQSDTAISSDDAELAARITAALSLEENAISKLIVRLQKKDDPYEPIARDVSEEHLRLIEALHFSGVYAVVEDARVYPETAMSGQVLGFLGKTSEGEARGNYGLEGFFDAFLAGTPGSSYTQSDSSGSWTGVGAREFTPAIDGGDLYLTIDRTLQIVACEKLAQTVALHNADSGALVMLDPKTGAVLAMCGAPDFFSGDYGSVADYAQYTNPTIFTPYEPGSIFKPLTMAGALDMGVVTPESTYTDQGFIDVGWTRPIKNAGEKVFGTVTMVEALEESVNTAMVWVMRQMGSDHLREYVQKFGFGMLSGIELNTENAGTIASLENTGEVYAATAAYGQGITVTPLQVAAAYGALANEGKLMKPYIVAKKRYPDGTIEEIPPTFLHQVITSDTAKKIAGMLVAVVEYGHGKRAGVPGYYIAGKTGTAQIAENGTYSTTAFNGSFAGFGPVEDPQFVMVVKIENPKSGVIYAESTAAPLFGEVADFFLKYRNIAPTR